MTCVIAYKDPTGKEIVVGADSLCTADGTVSARLDQKWFSLPDDDVLVAFTDSYRMGQLLQYEVNWKHEQAVEPSLYEWMVTVLVPRLRQAYRDHGYLTITNHTESSGRFLVVHRGRLFRVDSDFQVEEPTRYAALGSGEAAALGALYALDGFAIDPETKVRMALNAAGAHNIYVRPPFHVVHVSLA